MDRWFRKNKINLNTVTPLIRLAYMGNRSMGVFTYEPSLNSKITNEDKALLSLASLSVEALQVYQGSIEEVTEELYVLGGSPGGARPKALIGFNGNEAIAGINHLPENYQYWMVKFPTGKSFIKQSEGVTEYVYSLMARNAGIQFPETRLIDTATGLSFFACQRFDRKNHQPIHMHTMAGLLNADFRVPDCDYENLIKLTSAITSSHEDTCQAFRRMIFNVLSGNRDDHTKNFSFLMSAEGTWSLSPAYDVTFNYGINGQHSMSVMGEGKDISLAAIQNIADKIPLQKKEVKLIIDEVAEALSKWKTLAKEYAIPDEQINEIGVYIAESSRANSSK